MWESGTTPTHWTHIMNCEASYKDAFFRLCELVDYDDPGPMWSRICAWSARLRDVSSALPPRVIEIGCGASFKIIFALHRRRYSGVLEAVDLDSSGLDAQVQVHRWLKPGFSLSVSAEDVVHRRFESGSCLVVGNHFVDDFVAHQFPVTSLAYAEAYADPEKHRRYWSEVASLGEEHVARSLTDVLDAICEAPLLLNNYVSRFEKVHRLEEKVEFIDAVMRETARLLTHAGHPSEVSVSESDVWLHKRRGPARAGRR